MAKKILDLEAAIRLWKEIESLFQKALEQSDAIAQETDCRALYPLLFRAGQLFFDTLSITSSSFELPKDYRIAPLAKGFCNNKGNSYTGEYYGEYWLVILSFFAKQGRLVLPYSYVKRFKLPMFNTGEVIWAGILSRRKSRSCLQYNDLWNLPILRRSGILRS